MTNRMPLLIIVFVSLIALVLPAQSKSEDWQTVLDEYGLVSASKSTSSIQEFYEVDTPEALRDYISSIQTSPSQAGVVGASSEVNLRGVSAASNSGLYACQVWYGAYGYKLSADVSFNPRQEITSVRNKNMSLVGVTAFIWLTDVRVYHSIRNRYTLKLRGHANFNVGINTPVGNVVYTYAVTQVCTARPQ